MYTPRDIANELGISPTTLREKLRNNYAENHIENERWYFTRAEADEIKRRYPHW